MAPKDKALGQKFDNLFRTYQSMVYRAAYSITGSRQDAEDVLQTVFARMLRNGSSPKLLRDPKAYLRRSAINQALSVVESRERQNVADKDVEYLESPSRGAGVSEDDGIGAGLRQTLGQLKPQMVEIFILRYVDEHTEEQIAKKLGKTRTSVAVTLFRARRKLKKLMDPPGEIR
jgi:RNA polymerase sigma-70 factor (ECF subfamily)